MHTIFFVPIFLVEIGRNPKIGVFGAKHFLLSTSLLLLWPSFFLKGVAIVCVPCYLLTFFLFGGFGMMLIDLPVCFFWSKLKINLEANCWLLLDT